VRSTGGTQEKSEKAQSVRLYKNKTKKTTVLKKQHYFGSWAAIILHIQPVVTFIYFLFLLPFCLYLDYVFFV
jgi:hypothetical protein